VGLAVDMYANGPVEKASTTLFKKSTKKGQLVKGGKVDGKVPENPPILLGI
jgi:hypothetical protein